MTDVMREHIEIVQGAHGPKARIIGHRIRVQDVVIWHEKLGMSPDEIMRDHPTLSPADIYSALAYYWDYRDAIEQAIAEEQAFVDEFRRANKGPLLEKLTQLSRG